MKKTTLNFDNVKFNELTEDQMLTTDGGSKLQTIKTIVEIGQAVVEIVDTVIDICKKTFFDSDDSNKSTT